MSIYIHPAVLLRAARALRQQAHDIAAQSQLADPLRPQDTQQWQDALKLSQYLAAMKKERRNEANARSDTQVAR